MGPGGFVKAFSTPQYKVPPDTARSWASGRKAPSDAWVKRLVPLLGLDTGRTCALDGCGHALDGRRTYCACCPTHAEAGRKRRQRAARREETIP
jgi:hypothetical protein